MHSLTPERPVTHPIGLVLSGGGARAAYQVGVMKAIADILPPGCTNPFHIICGTSAGGLNAAGLACTHGNLREGVSQLEAVWGNFRTHQVYRTDWPGVLRTAIKWLANLSFGIGRQDQPVSLLDNTPLRHLLTQHLDFDNIQQAIDRRQLRAVCITASGYTSGASVSFYQGSEEIQSWRRSRRLGVRTQITVEHLLASAAIPLLFPAIRVNREYFGDGALRQIAPISPALHLGAHKVLVVGVSGHQQEQLRQRHQPVHYPSIAQVVSHIMNSSFIDGLEADIERVTRINNTLKFVPEEHRHTQVQLRPVDVVVLSPPGEILDLVAMKHAARLPKSIRLFVRGSGATHKSGAGVLSYLLFEAEYCRDLIELGYHDAMSRREDLLHFFEVPAQPRNNVLEFRKSDPPQG